MLGPQSPQPWTCYHGSMGLISIRQYARLRGIDESAVRKRTVARGGPIPTHGRAKRIDPDEADRLWRATMGPAGAATSRCQGPPEADPPPDAPGLAAAAASSWGSTVGGVTTRPSRPPSPRAHRRVLPGTGHLAEPGGPRSRSAESLPSMRCSVPGSPVSRRESDGAG